ncbi:MAG: tol-pal system-associated acyl-CoA thioesterase [Pseudomonadota bacterium]|nr:tol-pal system-associated acyl-CoA thioesterase [Pseudomonadota bacterium]
MKTITPDPHKLAVRVYYDDTDAGGIVYHANYLVFAERGRTEFLRAMGFDHNAVLKTFNLLLVIRHIDIDYRAPARLDDMLEIRTSVLACGRTSVTMKQDFYRADKLLTEITITVVGITPDGKAMALPAELRDLFVACQTKPTDAE